MPAVLAIAIAAEPTLEASQGPKLAAQFARLLAPISDRFGALAVTGGETARALLGAMGVAGLRLHGEIEAGVPLAVAQARTAAHDLPVVTKAGAFGTPETLVRSVGALRGLEPA
jgi:4-hydroxythreonine-4-phosphate dehydrogenase